MRRSVAACIALVAWAGAASAQVAATGVTFPSPAPGAPAALPRLQIPAVLRVPAGAGPVPAVVVVHSSGGIEDTNPAWFAALNAAGIATLEVDYFTPRGVATLFHPGTGAKPAPLEALADTVAALAYLSRVPGIDPARIGIVGFSFGGAQSLLATSLTATALVNAPLRFQAHVALYPSCSTFAPGGLMYAGAFDAAPVLILTGTADDYDGPDLCDRFVAGLPPESRGHYRVITYPGATHGFDKPNGPRTMPDPQSHQGRGGTVVIRPDPAATAAAIAAAVAFLVEALNR